MSKFISVVKFKVKTEDENNFIEAMQKYNLPEGLIFRKFCISNDCHRGPTIKLFC